jgi:hypothetical protein
MKNINEVRDELIEAFEMVKKDPRRVPQGKELGNIAGKIINSVKIQLEYSAQRKERPEIPFLNVTNL